MSMREAGRDERLGAGDDLDRRDSGLAGPSVVAGLQATPHHNTVISTVAGEDHCAPSYTERERT